LCNEPFNNLLKGNGQIYIFEDDIDYNHVNDICDKSNTIPSLKEYELSYSMYNHYHNKSAVTLFVNPLKYPSLVSLVLSNFLTNNDYPQDIKNLILSYYNDV